MKRIFLILYGILCLPIFGCPGNPMMDLYRERIAKNLNFLDQNQFPHEPGSGYPWLTVLFEGKKAVLLCPEDGIGNAILIFEDGSKKWKGATQDGLKLDYYRTIKLKNGKKWEELNLGSGWENLKIDSKEARSKYITRFFVNSFLRAVYAGNRKRESENTK